MNTYLAITIGPIYKTMQLARKTREIWSASYLFSYLMQCVTTEAKVNGQIIFPTDKGTIHDYHGAGIYPDRLIMILKDVSLNVQKTIIGEALKNVAEKLKIDKTELKNYLNIHFIIINENDLENIELLDKDGKPIESYIHKLNYLLDVKELQVSYTTSDENFIKKLFDHQTRKELYNIGLNKNHKFDSIFDITTQRNKKLDELKEKYKDEDDIDKNLFKDAGLENILEKHEKYIAILSADGDNFGKLLSKNYANDELITQFSKDIVSFSEKASDIIHKFGGTIIYIGGDDILALCPIKNIDKNIFNVVDNLNTAFHSVFAADNYKKENVSLSYGLSLSYYKYPLNEALKTSHDLLMDKAKAQPNKNCIAFQLLQNSGQYRETILEFGKDKSYASFLQMLNEIDKKEQLLQSLTHQLIEDKTLLSACLKNVERLNGYFENHYNLNDKDTDATKFITAMKQNLLANYNLFVALNKKLIEDKKGPIKNLEEETLIQMNTIARMLNFLMDKK